MIAWLCARDGLGREPKTRAWQAWGQVGWNASTFAFSTLHQVPGLSDFSTVVVNEHCSPLLVAVLDDIMQHQHGPSWLGAWILRFVLMERSKVLADILVSYHTPGSGLKNWIELPVFCPVSTPELYSGTSKLSTLPGAQLRLLVFSLVASAHLSLFPELSATTNPLLYQHRVLLGGLVDKHV